MVLDLEYVWARQVLHSPDGSKKFTTATVLSMATQFDTGCSLSLEIIFIDTYLCKPRRVDDSYHTCITNVCVQIGFKDLYSTFCDGKYSPAK